MLCKVLKNTYICSVNLKRSGMIDNLKSQMRKGMLEYCILLVLKKRTMYTTEIIETLRNSKLIVVEGTVYPILSRMKSNGLLGYYWQESTSGPPRKYFQITPTGELLLEDLASEWQNLTDTINHLQK